MSLNKSCCLLTLFIDVDVVHCSGLIFLNYGLYGLVIWHGMMWDDGQTVNNVRSVGSSKQRTYYLQGFYNMPNVRCPACHHVNFIATLVSNL